jgi:hypothetical protein
MAKFSARDNARREFSNLFVVGKDERGPNVWGYIHTPANGEPSIVELGENYLEAMRARGRSVMLRKAEIQHEQRELRNASH